MSKETAINVDNNSPNGVPSFPYKLYDILDSDNDDVIRWLSHGNGFKVQDTDRFCEEIAPKYFKHTKLTSFQRQLNLYGFRRMTKGEDSGAYSHPNFRKGKKELLGDIRRMSGKVGPECSGLASLKDEASQETSSEPTSALPKRRKLNEGESPVARKITPKGEIFEDLIHNQNGLLESKEGYTGFFSQPYQNIEAFTFPGNGLDPKFAPKKMSKLTQNFGYGKDLKQDQNFVEPTGGSDGHPRDRVQGQDEGKEGEKGNQLSDHTDTETSSSSDPANGGWYLSMKGALRENGYSSSNSSSSNSKNESSGSLSSMGSSSHSAASGSGRYHGQGVSSMGSSSHSAASGSGRYHGQGDGGNSSGSGGDECSRPDGMRTTRKREEESIPDFDQFLSFNSSHGQWGSTSSTSPSPPRDRVPTNVASLPPFDGIGIKAHVALPVESPGDHRDLPQTYPLRRRQHHHQDQDQDQDKEEVQCGPLASLDSRMRVSEGALINSIRGDNVSDSAAASALASSLASAAASASFYGPGSASGPASASASNCGPHVSSGYWNERAALGRRDRGGGEEGGGRIEGKRGASALLPGSTCLTINVPAATLVGGVSGVGFASTSSGCERSELAEESKISTTSSSLSFSFTAYDYDELVDIKEEDTQEFLRLMSMD